MSRITLISLTAVMVTLAASATASAKLFRFEDSYEYQVRDGFVLSVSNTAGNISVSHQAGDKVLIRVIKEIDGDSREDAESKEDRVEVAIKAGKDKIEIDTRYPNGEGADGFIGRLIGLDKGYNGTVSYQIEVPVSVNLAISTTSGDITLTALEGSAQLAATSADIRVRGLKGSCDVDNTSGDISIKDVEGNVDVTSTSSDALFDNIQGDISVQSTSGDTEAHWVTGRIQVTKTSGDVRVGKSSGDIDVSTTSGDIDIDQREGGFSLSTSSGEITVVSEFVKGSRFEAETISGNIEVRVPSEIKGDIRLETVSGNIETDLALEVRSFNRNKLEGRLHGGGAGIFLTSTSGDIILEEF